MKPQNILKKIIGKIMKKNVDLQKEQYRGTIKQLMKVNGLRTISLSNYKNWKEEQDFKGFHSVKVDIQDGYINLYGYSDKGRCGHVINDVTAEQYQNVYHTVLNILADESKIPYKVRKNILVKMSR